MEIVALVVAGVAVIALGAWLLMRNPWMTAPEPPPWLETAVAGRLVECVCGRWIAAGGPQHHLVVQSFDDDASLAGGAVPGGTAAAADFCPDCCPGGCQQGCVPDHLTFRPGQGIRDRHGHSVEFRPNRQYGNEAECSCGYVIYGDDARLVVDHWWKHSDEPVPATP